MPKINSKLSLSFLIVLLLIALAKLEIPGNTFLSRGIHNAGHFPFFGIFSLLILGLSSQFLGKKMNNRLWLYLVAFTAALSVGALHEYSQINGPRDADIWDLARDCEGSLCFLGIFMIYDKEMIALWKKWGGKIKAAFFIGVVILALSAFIPSLLWGEHIYIET